MKFATRAIHAGQDADPATGATIVPIYQTSTYTQQAVGVHKGFDYSRTVNPTRSALETQLAALEDAKHACAFASGMAATAAILGLLSSGDHVVVGDDLYGGTYRLFESILRRQGLDFTYADLSDPQNVRRSVKPNTKMIWIETPTNPLLHIVDIASVAAAAGSALLVVDNTFATPFFQQPLSLGAHIVMHSTTKYIGGHSDVLGGAAITSDEKIYKDLKFYQNAAGAVPGPFDAWLTMRGAKTLALRMREHQKNAQIVAEFLETRPEIERVLYPGLPSHPQHELAKRQMSGFGGIVTLTLKGPAERAMAFANRTKLFSLAESLGGVESLICHPAVMTHGSIPKAERERRGVTDGLLRLSVGIEDTGDLIADLQAALSLEATPRKEYA